MQRCQDNTETVPAFGAICNWAAPRIIAAAAVGLGLACSPDAQEQFTNLAQAPALAQTITQAQSPALSSKLNALAADMAPGTWLEIPDSSIYNVLATREEAPYRGGVSGPKSVILTWNGAAFDGRTWYFHGGGHYDYSGNEVYGFDFATLQWSRLTEPSAMGAVSDDNKCPDTVDGTPLATHTYDGFVYVPKTKSIWLFGSSPFCPPFGANPTKLDVWEFNPQTRRWRKGHDNLHGQPYKTAVDPVSGDILIADSRFIRQFDPTTQSYGRKSPEFRSYGEGNFEYDAKRKILWAMQGTSILSAARNDSASRIGELKTVKKLPKADVGGVPGLAVRPKDGLVVMWHGGRIVLTYDPATNEVTSWANPTGPAPTPKGRVFSKWIYLASLDVFAGYGNPEEGIWLYKLATGPQAKPRPVAGIRRVCPGTNYDINCDYDRIAAALKAAQDGETIAIRSGVYEEAAVIEANNLTIKAEKGAHMRGHSVGGKAALVIKGNNTLIEGLECSDVKIGGNGACVRMEGKNLIMRNVYFHHSEMGILAGDNHGNIIIEDSRFEDMTGANGTLGHSVYIGSTASLVFRRNLVLRTSGQGHGVKSRALKTLIENNVIASLNSPQSRVIDIPWGGETIIRGNILEQGPEADNNDMIGIALEKGVHKNAKHLTFIENNIVICDRPRCSLVSERSPGAVVVMQNKLVGPLDVAGDNTAVAESHNEYDATRAKAGFEPFPALPSLRN